MKVVMAFFLLLSACSFLAAQQPVWKELKSTEGGFSVLMPETPAPNKVTVETASGVKEAYMFTARDLFMREYMAAYSKYPGPNLKKISTVKLFDEVRDGILLAQRGKLLRETAVTLGGYSGREIAVERPDGVVMTARFYLVDDRFYQLSVEAKAEKRESEAIRQFLDSFELLRRRQP